MPWTSVYPMVLDSTKFAAGFAAPQGITQRAQRGVPDPEHRTQKMTFEDIKKGKLDHATWRPPISSWTRL